MQTFGIVENGQVRNMTHEEVEALCGGIIAPTTLKGNIMHIKKLFATGAGGGEQRDPPKQPNDDQDEKVEDTPEAPKD